MCFKQIGAGHLVETGGELISWEATKSAGRSEFHQTKKHHTDLRERAAPHDGSSICSLVHSFVLSNSLIRTAVILL